MKAEAQRFCRGPAIAFPREPEDMFYHMLKDDA